MEPRSEKLVCVVDKSSPKEAPADISPEDLKKLETWWDHDLKAKCYMLASVFKEQQRRKLPLEDFDVYKLCRHPIIEPRSK
ncbi:hypothetical protein F511_40452 [Dorcoceras hygrometricum]|uniref:Uncharacterized protein n=1 Tax=Dorcoceras hygrometricum TaxID=472368 RepID=A0A2Z7CHX4_9LAMI|nr:hypothetical protein F511_40452 [Dorcoceras hygrometricum]